MVLPFRPAYGVQKMSLPNSRNSYYSRPVIVTYDVQKCRLVELYTYINISLCTEHQIVTLTMGAGVAQSV
jgi:hypothetical protein